MLQRSVTTASASMLRLESLPDDVEADAVVAMPIRVARTLGDMLRTP